MGSEKGPKRSLFVCVCVCPVSMVAVDTHRGGRLEEDGGEHIHSSERELEAERTRGVMKKQSDNADDETKVRQVYVCVCQDQSNYQPCFPFFTHAHTHTAINRRLVEHNPLTVFLKCDYQLGRDIKLLYLSVCFYLSIFPSLSYTRTHRHTHFFSWISFSSIFSELLELSMTSTGNKWMSRRMSCWRH